MNQKKVLCVGIRSTDNLGDVAISDMILKLFKSSGYMVEQMEFNFSAVVSSELQSSPGHGLTRDFGAEKKTNNINRSVDRVFKTVGRIFKFIFYFPAVFLVFVRKSKGCSKIFIGGGNILMGIEYGFPLQVLCYVLFSKLLGKSVTFLCVGAGPFTAPGVKHILRVSLKLADRVVCRDSKSRELIEKELGDSLVVLDVLADPVLLWPAVKSKEEMKFDVLFDFMPLFSPSVFRNGDASKTDNFKSCMTDLVVELISAGKKVGIFVTDSSVDLDISEEIVAEVLSRTGFSIEIEIPVTPDDMAQLVSSAQVVFSTRMHGAIMSLSQSVPALCISWQPKIIGLYSDLSMGEFLVDLDAYGRFLPHKVLRKISKISENRQSYVDRINGGLDKLATQYDRLWAGI